MVLFDVTNKIDHLRHGLVRRFFHLDFVFTQVIFYLPSFGGVKDFDQAAFAGIGF